MQIQPLILAAGKGTRMRSSMPKVLQNLAGKPMLAHVLDSCALLTHADKPAVVVGYGSRQVRDCFGETVNYVEQSEQWGTGHAVQVALDELCQLHQKAVVLILYGDVPFIEASTLESVVQNAAEGALSMLTVMLDDPTGYGRIIRNSDHQVQGQHCRAEGRNKGSAQHK